jgi:hypothetical protein
MDLTITVMIATSVPCALSVWAGTGGSSRPGHVAGVT